MLSVEECLALQAELETLYRKHGTDGAVAEWLECSQQSVHRARTTARIGPIVAKGLYEVLGVSREILLAKHRELRPKVFAEEAKKAGADERELKLPTDRFPERALAARRAVRAQHWNITRAAIEYVCTAPEWQSPRFASRDAVFWVEQMKLQSAEEARAIPATEEERIFQEALRTVHARHAKGQSSKRSAAAGRTAAKKDDGPSSKRFKRAIG